MASRKHKTRGSPLLNLEIGRKRIGFPRSPVLLKPFTRGVPLPLSNLRDSKPARDKLKILMAAGEVSGDLQGSFLAQALLSRKKGLQLYGAGGPKMKAAGVDIRIDATQFSTVGVIEALRFLAPQRRALGQVQEIIREDPPDAAILIDNHGFNLMLAKFLKKEKIPVIYYFPPQVWIASSVFAKGIGRNTELIISSFEKEAAIYRYHGGRAVCLGHPLLDIVKPGPDPEAVLVRLGIDPSRPLVALMPGSRQHELERLAGPMFGAAAIIKRQIPGVQFILPVAAQHLRAQLEEVRRELGTSEEICYIDTDIYTCLSRCSLVITTTGTSTLEAALLGVPMVAAYRVNLLSGVLGRMFSCTPYAALPNVLLNELVVPEFIQLAMAAERLAEAALEILENPSRQAAMRKRFSELPAILGTEGVLDRVADLVLHEVSKYCRPQALAT